MSLKKLSPDQITTLLGVTAALKVYFFAQGWIDANTDALFNALLALAAGYYSNRKP
ncbi:MAG: hypothetical protein F6K28_27810 [Microcoleus sp. SIO2G3]|nr:hypothetical protein [Microcoleus sp. SIO2G3]